MHDPWHGPNACSRINVPARTTACSSCVNHVCPRTCARESSVVPPPTHNNPCANKGMPPCVHVDDCCMPESWHVRACVNWVGGDITAAHGRYTEGKGVDSVRRRQVAAPSGPPRSAMPRLPPAPQPAQAIACSIPEQCARGGPTTSAVGYCSVIRGTRTTLGFWMA